MRVKVRAGSLDRLAELPMLLHPQPRPPMRPALTTPWPADERTLLDQARALQRAAIAGRTQQLLRGKNLGLLCQDDTLAQARLFRQAASELGAHVAHIGMSLGAHSSAQEVARTAQWLGRLYDAVECQGLPDALVRQMAEAASIAIYAGLTTSEPLISLLAAQLSDECAAADNRRYALQAVLLHTIF